MNPSTEMIKAVAVGYSCVGKTTMLTTYYNGEYTEPTCYLGFDDGSTMDLQTSEGSPVKLSLWDTIGQEDYERLRPLSYLESNVFLLCFSIENSRRTCFEKTKSYWYKELHRYCPDVPIILVGTKIDLRDDENYKNTITTEEGREMADKIGAVEYMEISSLRNEGLNELFQKAVDVGYDHCLKKDKKRNKRTCILM